jgi:hypothetical protein
LQKVYNIKTNLHGKKITAQNDVFIK